ncbi:hypothetical protein [Methylobacterium sp. SI9]|uniref:hypothetical protein n=1 Tax=Methylobacterium guangdongense TaxID=3138811 RepID=UPI00313C2C99
MREYVVRPGEAKPPAPAAEADAPAQPEAKGLSSALIDRLSVQMTEAVGDAFAVSPWTAIAALLAGMTCKNPWQSPVRIRNEGIGAAESAARNNESFEALFARFVAMPMPDLLSAAGKILAGSLDLRTRTPGSGATAGCPADSRAIQLLTGAIEADVLAARVQERFDAAAFFGSAPKTVSIAAIEEACGAEAAARAAKLKKGQIVELAVAEVMPTGWLPGEIRWPGYAGPGAAASQE